MNSKVYVWDKFIRVFHWSLVALFTFSYLTGESESDLHAYSGYLIIALVLMRILWGFIGSKYARFKDFVKTPGTVIRYAKSMASEEPEHYRGHNPLGGLMVVAMLATLLMITFSGLKLYAAEEGKGPFAASYEVSLLNQSYADSDDDSSEEEGDGEGYEGNHEEDEEAEEFWEEIHETAVNFMLLLILLHIGGVVFSSKIHKESLVKAMVTGYKEKDPEAQ